MNDDALIDDSPPKIDVCPPKINAPPNHSTIAIAVVPKNSLIGWASA